MRIFDWLEDRTGYRGLLHAALGEEVKGGARWRYVFGSGLAIAFLMQAVSGVGLAAYYSPSVTGAWASVNYLQEQVYLGWLLRGMHHHGASAMVILCVLHLLQTLMAGAYQAPRELNWLLGFLLFQLVLGFALTGYLLPWDQTGYWATQVATSIAGTLPGLGEGAQQALQGGAAYGNLTLTRFYALHILILPALTVALLVAHVALFRRHGVTYPRTLSPEEAERSSEPFFPRQFLFDALFGALIVGAVFAAAAVAPAPLTAPADPSSQFLARPEWYFLPLFQLLKYFEGSAELLGTVVLPGVALGTLALLPFLHAFLQKRTQRAHAVMVWTVVFGLVGVAGLGGLAVADDAKNPELSAMRAQSAAEAAQAKRLALAGVPTDGPLFLYRNDPVVHGERVFRQSCATCHKDCQAKPYKGDVCLESYASRAWLSAVIAHPQAPHFFGNVGIDEMEPYQGPALPAIVEFLYAQGGRADANAELAKQGLASFEAEGCAACHSLTDEPSEAAPSLGGYASVAWLSAFIRLPEAPQFYGKLNKMEAFDHQELPDAELSAVVSYLRAQALRPMNIPLPDPSRP